MADFSGSNYSELDASNSNSPPAGAPEGQAPSTVNDTMRAHMGANKRWYDRDHAGTWVTVGGTANAITLTYAAGPASYVQGEKFAFKATAANTGATTVNVQSLGAKSLFKKTGSGPAAMTGGEIQAGDIVEIEFDGTQFQIVGPLANVGDVVSSANNTLSGSNTFSGAKQTFSKQTVGTPVTGLGTSGTITLDLSTGNNFHLGALTGATTFANPTNAVAGQSGVITVSTNGQTTDWGANFHWPNGVKPAGSGGFDVYSYYVFSSTFIVIAQTRAVA